MTSSPFSPALAGSPPILLILLVIDVVIFRRALRPVIVASARASVSADRTDLACRRGDAGKTAGSSVNQHSSG
jgi:hypothetical protein